MSIVKDWREDNSGYRLNRQVLYFFSPKVWLRLHKWRKQRADRGWSDRDTWGAGEHIAQMTAEMLQHLNDNTYVDWPEWFKTNTKDNKGYKNLQSVIDDINGYLDFRLTSWSDGLDIASYNVDDWLDKQEGGTYVWKSAGWVDKTTGKKLTEKQLLSRMKKHHKQEEKIYKKATHAMEFFGHNFASFWD